MGDYKGMFGKYLKLSSFYVLLKLNSGDTLMAMLKEDNEEDILIQYPFEVKSFSVVTDEGIGEATSIKPWIGTDTDKYFYLPKSAILIMKPLAARMIPTYLTFLKRYEFPEMAKAEQEKTEPKTKEMEKQPQKEDVNDLMKKMEELYGKELDGLVIHIEDTEKANPDTTEQAKPDTSSDTKDGKSESSDGPAQDNGEGNKV